MGFVRNLLKSIDENEGKLLDLAGGILGYYFLLFVCVFLNT